MPTTDSEDRVKPPAIRDKAFAKRLEIACDGNPNCPTDQYRGKQKWVYDNLLSEFGTRVSPEAVREWFSGAIIVLGAGGRGFVARGSQD